ncbi:MAG: S9 family peptidase [Candidatus Bipolaricaulota bacterium]|nr:S9 family peptidase [Candidatus Bipolaricaulota bacterium]
MSTAKPIPIIPRTVLFGNPDKIQARLSPDGSQIAFLAPLNGVLNVWVAPRENPDAAKPVTRDTKRGIQFYFWAHTNRHILYIQDKEGDENWRIYSVDLATDQIKDLTPFEGVQAQIYKVSYKLPTEILIGLNNRDPQMHDVYRLNIETGERVLLLENTEGLVDFVSDDLYTLRLATRFTPDGGNEVLRRTAAGTWELFATISQEDSLTTGPRTLDKTGQVVYMFDSRGRDTSALVAIHLETGERQLLFEDPNADVSDVLIHPTERTVQAVASIYERKHWTILDNSIAKDFEYLQTVADGEIEVVSRTLDDTFWIVAYLMDDGPVRYYLYQRPEQKALFLFTNRKELENLPLAKMHPVLLQSRDGLTLVSYLTLPVWTDPDGDGRPEEPLPMVLVVHGGPWARDTWGYDPFHQWLANRGYAVLSVNFRGSTGFGKRFVNAGDKEWGAKMHDDLVDAVQWAISEKIADPKRIAIMGGSYGGYATLVGLTFTPELFACGVDIVGPSNLVTLLSSIPPYWVPMLSIFTSRVGDHRTEEGQQFLLSRSPLTYVERICRPLLIGQGANDPRVKQAESDQIVQAMQAKQIPVTYVLFPDEGHGFVRPENRLAFFAVAEAFLARHLGSGRVEPIGEDFRGSSITIPVGVDDLSDVSAALQSRQ